MAIEKTNRFRKKDWHTSFIDALARYGNITTAANIADVSRMTYYREMKHREFQELCHFAFDSHRDSLLLRLTTLAMGGTEKDPVPSSISLVALKFLITRADRRLEATENYPMGSEEELSDSNEIVIEVTEDLARSLFQHRLAAQAANDVRLDSRSASLDDQELDGSLR